MHWIMLWTIHRCNALDNAVDNPEIHTMITQGRQTWDNHNTQSPSTQIIHILHIVHRTTPVYMSTMTIHNGLNNHTLLNAYNHVYNNDTDLKTISIIHQMRVSKIHGYNLKGYETMLLYYDQLLAR